MKISFNKKNNHIATGRGAVAIYLALVNEHITAKKVLVPANICYAAVYPIILSGNTPVFCDVNKATGNVDIGCIKSAFEKDVAVAVIPHMYGNIVCDMPQIVDFLHSNGAVVIEDCASSLGAVIDNCFAGDFGDYAVYSFGHSKTIDIGNGGILSSDRNLDTAYSHYIGLPMYNEATEKDNDFFSKIYRVIRNNPNPDWARRIYQALSQKAKEMYLYRISCDFELEMERSLENFESVVERRRNETQLYRSLLKFNPDMCEYIFLKGASPWRYNILVEPERRKPLIAYLLSNNVPVSDWYPVVTDIFFDEKEYPNAKFMEKRILNFPLITTEDEIVRICGIVNRFFEG